MLNQLDAAHAEIIKELTLTALLTLSEEAVDFHRDLVRDHNRLPHWAHHHRNDAKCSPPESSRLRENREIRHVWVLSR